MSKPTSNQSTGTGLALGMAFFVVSIFLWSRPSYFGTIGPLPQVACLFMGFAGLGTELDKLAKRDRGSLVLEAKASGLFTNLGMGTGFLVIWAWLYASFDSFWINVAAFFVLLFGAYAVLLGLVYLLFLVLPGPGEEHPTPAPESPNSGKRPLSVATRIAVAIAGLTAFTASLLQILQIAKILP